MVTTFVDIDRGRLLDAVEGRSGDVVRNWIDKRDPSDGRTGHRGRKGGSLYGLRRLLLMAWANLNDKGWERLRAGLTAGDRDGEIAAVWLARELLGPRRATLPGHQRGL